MLQRIATGRTVIALGWDGDDLVDRVDGPDRWPLDGTSQLPPIRRELGGPFDQATMSPSGRYHAVYAERGTKALLMRGGDTVRELNRSYVHAEDFDYPLALGALPDGRDVVVHCPDAYNKLEIEEAETGRRLTTGERATADIFHSRLAVSPDGRHLLSAGWFWHPYGTAMIFDLVAALADPTVLDDRGSLAFWETLDAEVSSACWLDTDRVAVATTTEGADDPGGVTDGLSPGPVGSERLSARELGTGKLGPGQLGVWSVSAARWLHRSRLTAPIGTMVPCGGRAVSLFGHPRLLDPESGAVIAEWPGVDAGHKDGSYGVTHVPTPITALHPDGRRLAIVQPTDVAVLTLPTT